MRQTVIIVTSSSMIVQIVAGMRLSVEGQSWGGCVEANRGAIRRSL